MGERERTALADIASWFFTTEELEQERHPEEIAHRVADVAAPLDAEGRESARDRAIRLLTRRLSSATAGGTLRRQEVEQAVDAIIGAARGYAECGACGMAIPNGVSDAEHAEECTALATADPEGEPCERCGGRGIVCPNACLVPVEDVSPAGSFRVVCSECREGVVPCPDCGTPDESEPELYPGKYPVYGSEHDSSCATWRSDRVACTCGAQPDEETEGEALRGVSGDDASAAPSPSSGEVLLEERAHTDAVVEMHHAVRKMAGIGYDSPLHDLDGFAEWQAARDKLNAIDRALRARLREVARELERTSDAREHWREGMEAKWREANAARSENERLRVVLDPFADHGEALEGCDPTDQWCEAEAPDGFVHWLAVEHFHAAARIREALDE